MYVSHSLDSSTRCSHTFCQPPLPLHSNTQVIPDSSLSSLPDVPCFLAPSRRSSNGGKQTPKYTKGLNLLGSDTSERGAKTVGFPRGKTQKIQQRKGKGGREERRKGGGKKGSHLRALSDPPSLQYMGEDMGMPWPTDPRGWDGVA